MPRGRSFALVLTVLGVACSRRPPATTIASAPALAPARPDDPVAAVDRIDTVDPPADAGAPAPVAPVAASSLLVPCTVDTRWSGRGAPPTDYSIFAVPETSPARGHWNSEHRNHFHLELTTHDWVLVR